MEAWGIERGISLLVPTLARCNGAPTGMRQSRELAPLGKHPRRRPSPSNCLVGSFHVVVVEDWEQITRLEVVARVFGHCYTT